jgi:hypothetical protein
VEGLWRGSLGIPGAVTEPHRLSGDPAWCPPGRAETVSCSVGSLFGLAWGQVVDRLGGRSLLNQSGTSGSRSRRARSRARGTFGPDQLGLLEPGLGLAEGVPVGPTRAYGAPVAAVLPSQRGLAACHRLRSRPIARFTVARTRQVRWLVPALPGWFCVWRDPGVIHNAGFLAHDPGVVPGLHHKDIAWPNSDLCPVV